MVSKKAKAREFFNERFWSLKQRDRIEYLLHLERIEKAWDWVEQTSQLAIFTLALVVFLMDLCFVFIPNFTNKLTSLLEFNPVNPILQAVVLIAAFFFIFFIIYCNVKKKKAIKKLNKRFNLD